MITEAEARELLARAAGMIEVPAGTPTLLTPRQRPPWIVPLVAAAAVAAAVVAGLVFADRGREPAPDPAPSPTGVKLPSVFGYRADEAEKMLTALGLKVEVRTGYDCADAGRALRTNPGAGTQAAPGDPVTLVVKQAPPGLCGGDIRNLAWAILDFADGRGSSPSFADEVTVWVDGVRSTLTRQQAQDPATWGADSAIGFFLAAGRLDPGTGFSSTVQPQLRTEQDDYAGDFVCGGQEWPEDPLLDGRKALWMDLAVPSNDPLPCVFLDVFTTGSSTSFDPSGQIDAVVLRTWRRPVAQPSAPTATGNPTVSGREVAQEFLAFAEGSAPAPPFADQVRLYLQNEHVRTITAAQAADRSSYDVVDACFPDPEADCPRSAIDMLNLMKDRTIREGFDECLGGALDLLDGSEIGSDHRTVMVRPSVGDCERPWAVQLIYDFEGRIAKVNLRIPETH